MKRMYVSPGAKYQMRRLPFGLVRAPFTFASAMLRGLCGTEDFIPCNFDDILICPDMISHMNHVKALLILAEAGMQINLKKCDSMKQKVHFVGHSIVCQGIKLLQSKLKGIVHYGTPQKLDQLCSFLGLASFYWKCSEICCYNSKAFVWTINKIKCTS